MAQDLEACIDYAVRNIEVALEPWYGKADNNFSWGQAESWMRKAELLMRDGAAS
jgi:hypothetical protein